MSASIISFFNEEEIFDPIWKDLLERYLIRQNYKIGRIETSECLEKDGGM